MTSVLPMGVNLRNIADPKRIELEELGGKTVAIDAFNTLYQFLSIIRGMTGELLRDNKGRVTSHLSGLFYRNMNLLEEGMKLIYVFDGIPPKLKSLEIQRRREVKVVAGEMYKEALERKDYEAAKKFASATAYLDNQMVDESKNLLDLMGIPWVQAPSEGEATAAYLTTTGRADFAGSQDYDSLLFGALRLVRNLTISGKRKLPNRNTRVDVIPETVYLSDVLGKNGITREQLIDIGILLGTDFNPDGFAGIGPATALKLVKKYSRIENMPDLKGKMNFDPNEIREIFLHPKVSTRDDLVLTQKPPQNDALLSFLVDEHNFSKERIDAALQRLNARKNVESQSLEQWFS
ncbi:MAG TPA: flap endonuclease-1 [Nitrososphaerales archaeon]|nr:flap endonuclease-1 [Nitrososphaerales archaeon]